MYSFEILMHCPISSSLRRPRPTAAMNAAQAAALLAMTARYCDGPVHAGHAKAVGEIIAEADRLRDTCVALMAADGESYGGVMAAYRLPKDTQEERVTRAAAIAAPMK